MFFFSLFLQAPLIVFEDSPIDVAVAGASGAAFIASGQVCVAATRILIHNSKFKEFTNAFVERCKKIEERMGDRESLEMRS